MTMKLRKQQHCLHWKRNYHPKKKPHALASILKGDTEEFTSTASTGTLRSAPNPDTKDKNEKEFVFSHRAYTLKKLQVLLSEDEQIEHSFKSMRLTLRGSKRVHTLRSMRSVDSMATSLANHLDDNTIKEEAETDQKQNNELIVINEPPEIPKESNNNKNDENVEKETESINKDDENDANDFVE
eukprot:397933_1